MFKINLRQPGFTYSTCGPFAKNREGIQNIKETGDSRYIYQNELDKACFQHDMAYGNFKDLPRRTASDKHYVKELLILLKMQNMMDISVGLLQWFTNVLIKILLLIL